MQFERQKWTSKVNLCRTNFYHQNENIERLKIFNNRIRATLKIVKTPLHLSFNVAFQTNTFYRIWDQKGSAHFQFTFCHFFRCDMRGGSSRRMMNTCDMGGEVKNVDIWVTYVLDGPLQSYSNVGRYQLVSVYLHTDQQFFYTFI